MQCLSFDSYESLFKIDHFLISNRFGVRDHVLTHRLVEHAKSIPPSFDPVAPRKYSFSVVTELGFKGWFHHLTYSCLVSDDEAKSKRVLSSNGYHKFL